MSWKNEKKSKHSKSIIKSKKRRESRKEYDKVKLKKSLAKTKVNNLVSQIKEQSNNTFNKSAFVSDNNNQRSSKVLNKPVFDRSIWNPPNESTEGR